VAKEEGRMETVGVVRVFENQRWLLQVLFTF
jgi:hypothetical protein